MSRVKQLAKHIERTFSGPMWHGPALVQTLEGITAERAAARPLPGAHSIWELVLHITAWAEIARARLKQQRVGDPSVEEDWPAVGTTDAPDWQLALDQLAAS